MQDCNRDPQSAEFLGTPLTADYAALDSALFRTVQPTPVSHPRWIHTNKVLAKDLGIDIDQLNSDAALSVLSGNSVVAHSTPIAQAYAGHQFGYFNPQLGDGRAVLLGELQCANGTRVDLQLKGAGQTPFSRSGDGRSAIGPVIREFIVSEAMHALGISTSRCLAAVATGDSVFRNGEVPGGVVTRVARSHVRVGTFEFLRAHGKKRALKVLADHIIGLLYPELADSQMPYSALVNRVAQEQAKLIAQWMRVGFIHGVMNTDNFTVSGETLDYGPCAFMDEYNPDKVFSSIDREGRYAFSSQPNIAIWNLARFGEALSPLLKTEAEDVEATVHKALQAFQQEFSGHWNTVLANKIGLTRLDSPLQVELVESLLALFAKHQVDFTLGFRQLIHYCGSTSEEPSHAEIGEIIESSDWLSRWQEALKAQQQTTIEACTLMENTNPLYIPRNHLIERVIQDAERGDFASVVPLYKVVQTPYRYQPGNDAYLQAPSIEERVTQTFCGT